MMTRLKFLAFVAVLSMAACRDAAFPNTPVPTTRKVAALTALQMDSVVAVTLTVSGFVGNPIVSVSASVDYDTATLRYLGDQTVAAGADGAMRAARDAGGRVMLAAAHGGGFPGDTIMTLHFALRANARSAEAITPPFALTVRELMQRDASNAVPQVFVTPSATMMRWIP